MLLMILEAAFRSLLMALAVLAGMRLLRVQAVLAQKVAWVLVLLAAGAMPLVMRAPWLALNQALRIPIRPLSRASRPVPQTQTSALQVSADSASAGPIRVRAAAPNRSPGQMVPIPKPSAAHALGGPVEHDSVSAEPVESVTLSASAEPKSAAIPVHAEAGFAPDRAQSSSQVWVPNWAQIKLAILVSYLAVFGLLMARTLTGLGIAWRIWQRSEPVADFMGDANAPMRVRVSPDLSTPVTIGSSIVLPADWRDWDAAKLRIVLAHEHSHVRQGDFYLQLLAALHLAVFWFSPLGWWLQRKISELGEALSDRAGLEQATDPASYAQILLEFAAMPRSYPFAGALTGVAMARSSNLSSRIERVLNARLFRLAFLGSRRHAFLAAVLVPVALVAVVACIRIVPAVEAAQAQDNVIAGKVNGTVMGHGPVAGVVASTGAGPSTAAVADGFSGQITGQITGELPEAQISVESGQANVPLVPPPPLAPVAPNPPSPDGALLAPFVPMSILTQQVMPPMPSESAPVYVPQLNGPTHVYVIPPSAAYANARALYAMSALNKFNFNMNNHFQLKAPGHGFAYAYSDGDDDSFAIIRGKEGNTVTINGHSGRELEKVRQKYHGDFIWFERDGKSYVIQDPAIVAQAEAMFKGDPELDRQMNVLNAKEDELNKKMELLEPEMRKASLPGPEFEEQMKRLQAQLAELQSDKYKKLTEQVAKAADAQKKLTDDELQELTQEKLGELQEKIGDIQGQIGEIQGKIGERQGEIGEKQGELGEQMGKIGEEMGKIGEKQGKMAEEASKKLRSVLDQALKDGTAKPVE